MVRGSSCITRESLAGRPHYSVCSLDVEEKHEIGMESDLVFVLRKDVGNKHMGPHNPHSRDTISRMVSLDRIGTCIFLTLIAVITSTRLSAPFVRWASNALLELANHKDDLRLSLLPLCKANTTEYKLNRRPLEGCILRPDQT